MIMLNNLIGNYSIILGSASPRRRQLLNELGIAFTIKTADIEEHAPKHLNSHETAIYIAKDKAEALRSSLSNNEILITADTEVWQDDKRFGKPKSLKEAREMLLLLSGAKHDVISGVCFTTRTHQHCFSVDTEVYMRNLNTEELEFYFKAGNPLDKAGAYGIQEWIGLIGIERINGSYTNVVGMPMAELYSELKYFLKQITPK